MPGEPTWALAEQIATLEVADHDPTARFERRRCAPSPCSTSVPSVQVTTPLGRSGVGFALDTADGTEVLVFDPGIGQGASPTGAASGRPSSSDWRAAASWTTCRT